MPDAYWDEEEAEQLRQRDRAERANGAAPDDDLDLGEWDFGEDNEPIPPRAWLLGNLLCRQFLSSLFADGGVGKTALIIAMALSLATGRSLIGEHVFVRCKVLLVCFEDGKDELRRRLTAAMVHYGIAKADIQGHLFVTAINRSDAKLALMKDGAPQVGKLRDALKQSITRRAADVMFLDPLIKAHAVGESDNAAMDFVAEIMGDIVIEHDIGSCSPHHTRKGPPDPGNADVGRGASSLKDAFRLCHTLNPMSKEEADLLGVPVNDRASLIRLDSAKVNLVRHSLTPRWFRLVGVSIGNGTELYPNGDEIQVIERWYPPDHFKGVGDDIWNLILDDIDAGTADGGKYSDHGKAKKERQAWRVVARHTGKTESQCKLIIKTWKTNGVINLEPYHDPDERKDRLGFSVDDAKRPGPRGE
jgi:AAA domain